MTGNGLQARAWPTARAAPGLPRWAAIKLYVLTFPHGIACSARNTACWNGEQRSSRTSSREKRILRPLSDADISEQTASIRLQSAASASENDLRAPSTAEQPGLERMTLTIFGFPPIKDQRTATDPKGVDLIKVIFIAKLCCRLGTGVKRRRQEHPMPERSRSRTAKERVARVSAGQKAVQDRGGTLDQSRTNELWVRPAAFPGEAYFSSKKR